MLVPAEPSIQALLEAGVALAQAGLELTLSQAGLQPLGVFLPQTPTGVAGVSRPHPQLGFACLLMFVLFGRGVCEALTGLESID